MKRIVLVLTGLFLLAIIFSGIFIFSFDANRYKGVVEQAIEKSIGEPVSIGHISLQWKNGIALQLSKVAVSNPSNPAASPGISLENLILQVDLLPLFKKTLKVSSITLDRPFAEITREAGGSMKVGGIDFSKSIPSSAASSGRPNSTDKDSPMSWSVDSITVREGRLLLHDFTGSKPITLEVEKIDVRVPHFTQKAPFAFEALFSLLSERQNIRSAGSIQLGGANPAELRQWTISTDLKDVDFRKTCEVFPSLTALKQRPEGSVSVTLEEFSVPVSPSSIRKGSLEFKQGKVELNAFPIENINLSAEFNGSKIKFSSLTGTIAGAPAQFSGTLSGLDPQSSLAVKGEIRDLSLQKLMKVMNPNAPQLNGHITLVLEGRAQGIAWEGISRTLNGRARLIMNDGVILNYNILREIIQKISIIPGAQEALQANFPQAYRLRLQDQSTVLRPVDLSANIVNGVFQVDPLRIDTDFIILAGAGGLGLDRSIHIVSNLIVNQEISRAIVGAFNPLQVLGNNRGEIVIPVTITGELPQIRIIPDSKYITSKLIAGKTQEVLQQFVADPKKGLGSIEDLLKKNLNF